MSYFDTMFNDFFNDTSAKLRTDINEENGNYVFYIQVPGVKKEDIKVGLKNGYLNIEANKEDRASSIRQEITAGRMTRSFYIGDGYKNEDIHATLENGELILTLPKEAPKQVEENHYISID